jgi:SAM-dependent methyltransferase
MSVPGRSSMAIELPWEQVRRTAKYCRMLQRREKILGRLDVHRRQVGVLEALLDGVRHDDVVLEVACGMGFHLLELAARGWARLVGLEIDPELSLLSRDAACRFDLPFRALTGDACAIPLADGSCGAVLSQSFFEHVYDVNRALSEQIRVLRPGGRLLILDGNLLNPKTVCDLLFLYPLRTRGRHGGLRWLFAKRRVHQNLYGYLRLGRDEDIHSPGWWRRRLARDPRLTLHAAGTGGDLTHPALPRPLRRLLGSCVVVAEKR